VAMESQPVALTRCILVCTCSSNADAVPCVWQCTSTDGSVGGAGTTGFTTRISVAMESQPVALTRVSLYVPAA
jgi:hypothetical protein